MNILGNTRDKYELAWTGLEIDAIAEYLRNPDIYNPLENKLQIELENKGLREIFLMYDPDYLWYTVKMLLNIELHPIQAAVLGQMMTHSFPMLIGSRGFSKSFLMAVYALIRAILFPGSKIVITGAAFRQSKFVFEYVENMYYNSPILQSIYKGNRPSARLPDFWTFHLNESKIFALPTGCLTEDTLVTTENGIRYINKLNDSDNYVWSVNKFKKIGFKHNNGTKPTKRIITDIGLEIKGTYDHKIKVYENNNIKWKELQDIIVGDKVLIDISERWFNHSVELTKQEAYNLGFNNQHNNISYNILCSSKSSFTYFLSGLFDNIGTFVNGDLLINSDNLSLLNMIQYVLFHFSVVSHIQQDLLIIKSDDFRKFLKIIIKFDKMKGSVNSTNIVKEKFHFAKVVQTNDYLSLPTFDLNVPDDNTYIANGLISHNTGEKIRGMRGNIIICDEFNSISTEVYEIVISQFAAVSSSPIENIKAIAKKAAQARDGIVEQEHKKLSLVQNQSIISGTMKYQFEPMAIYWEKYKAIIDSRGERLIELFGELGEALDWRDFCIIRIPFELIPKGFMDDKIVARARSTMHSEFYAAEYGCVPISDSMGFFKRSLIESCTSKLENVTKDNWPTWCPSTFDVKLQGNPNLKYVMGIDPAYNQDNFAIVILEVLEEHSRIVYAWSTSKRTFNKSGPVDEKNYFNFCARKIRDLMKSFNIVGIAIDTQGGGYSILECLHDPDKMQSGELPLWPVINPDKPQDTDDFAGSHIITLCQFSSADWVSTNNHGMKKDMEDKVLLFPQFNSILLGLASEKDKEELLALGMVRDSLEDCMVEVEELKDELCLIVRTTTLAGRERFDTPAIIVGSNKKEYLRKDRYSALLIANSIARTIQRSPPPIPYHVVGAAKGTTQKSDNTRMYYGPDWASNMSSNCFRGIKR